MEKNLQCEGLEFKRQFNKASQKNITKALLAVICNSAPLGGNNALYLMSW